MSAEWYYLLNNESHGPVSSDSLQELADIGTVKPSTPVRRNYKGELSPWTRAGAIQKLFSSDVTDQLGPTICDDCGTVKAGGVCPNCEAPTIAQASIERTKEDRRAKPPVPRQPIYRRYFGLRRYIGILEAVGLLILIILSMAGFILSIQAGMDEDLQRLILSVTCFASGGLTYLVAKASAEFLQLAIDAEESLRELLAESRRINDSMENRFFDHAQS